MMLYRSYSGGFVMLTLLMTITLVSIVSTRLMLNSASEVQQEQEAELIFRGEAIANAIHLYKKKTGRYPSTLKDLTDIRPRIIRKLYKDPMTILDDRYKGDWNLVSDTQSGTTFILGVRSFCNKDSRKIYKGRDLISDWFFGELPSD